MDLSAYSSSPTVNFTHINYFLRSYRPVCLPVQQCPIFKTSLLRFDRGDISFIVVAGAMVSFMVPGLAFLYSGLSRRKSARMLPSLSDHF